MKNLEHVKEILQRKISYFESEIAKLKEKMEKDYTRAFIWGVPANLLETSLKLESAKGVLDYFSTNPELVEDILHAEIRSHQRAIEVWSFSPNMGGEFQNIATRIEMKVGRDMAIFYETLIIELKTKN